jgi:hypothetical protein
MSTEVWFRNPWDYIRELVEVGECRIAWDRGLLVKRNIDPVKHAELYFTQSMEYRVLCVGTQGTAEYRPGDTLDTPTAVYPTWAYGEDSLLLESMLENPFGEDEDAINDMTVRSDERPVRGQEHRVVITEPPNMNSHIGRSFLRYLKTLQEDHPDAIIHIHGLYGWKTAFGMGIGAADVEPRSAASKGRVHLPSGGMDRWEKMVEKPQWAAALGFKPSDLSVPRNRCMYNIKSALWAGENYTELFKFKTQGEGSTDYTSPDSEHTPVETKSHMSKNMKSTDGDRFLCDVCSLQNNCKYFRQGSVCTVPGAEPVRLSQMFNTRNADDIIDGLSLITSAGANRLERSMKVEQAIGDVDPDVTKMMAQVFDQGVKLAKLLEPQRFSSGSKVQVNVGGAAAEVSTANPRQLAASIVQALVAQGVPRDKITPDMISGFLENMANPDAGMKAIQGSVLPNRGEQSA